MKITTVAQHALMCMRGMLSTTRASGLSDTVKIIKLTLRTLTLRQLKLILLGIKMA